VVGLGANLGDRLEALREAASRIDALSGVAVVARSAVYETAPVGGPAQGDFLNAAVAAHFERAPEQLLDGLQRIEADLGRTREVRWGPRTLDLDVLWIEGLALDTARLVVPHPRLAERAFALLPLLDVAPDACDPRTGVRYASLVESVASQGARRTSLVL